MFKSRTKETIFEIVTHIKPWSRLVAMFVEDKVKLIKDVQR